MGAQQKQRAHDLGLAFLSFALLLLFLLLNPVHQDVIRKYSLEKALNDFHVAEKELIRSAQQGNRPLSEADLTSNWQRLHFIKETVFCAVCNKGHMRDTRDKCYTEHDARLRRLLAQLPVCLTFISVSLFLTSLRLGRDP